MSSLEYYPPIFPKYSHNQYIKFENLQIVSPSGDVKMSNVLGHYLRKYGIHYFLKLRPIFVNSADNFGKIWKNKQMSEKTSHLHYY